ncbi:MAG: Lpg1974 family pore-forming outer membrane protein [Pirellulales bacterium]
MRTTWALLGLLCFAVAGTAAAQDFSADPYTDFDPLVHGLPDESAVPSRGIPSYTVPGDGCDGACQECAGDWTSTYAAVELTFLKPYFSTNTAAIDNQTDDFSFASTNMVAFSSPMTLAPRVWIGRTLARGYGGRIGYWYLTETPADITLSPAGSGFGTVSSPILINNSDYVPTTSNPDDAFTASSELTVYTIDGEGTKYAQVGDWQLCATGGLRYGSIAQSYLANVTDSAGDVRSTASFGHHFIGVGPTLSLELIRPLNPCWAAFGRARGSVLFGNVKNRLTAVEDADLDSPFTTSQTNNQSGVVPIGELRVGVERVVQTPYAEWFLRVALEGQFWLNVGSAAQSTGDLGLFGFTTALGVSF